MSPLPKSCYFTVKISGGGYASLPVPQLLKNDTDSTEFFKTKYLTILLGVLSQYDFFFTQHEI